MNVVIFAWKWDSLKESQNFGKVGFVKKGSFNDKFNQNIQCIPISLHIFNSYYRYQKGKYDMSIDSTKKSKFSRFDFSHTFYNIWNI